MPGLTETELMASYDKSLTPTTTTVEPASPSVQPRMLHRGARVCLRGHILPHGGRCSACQKLGKKGPVRVKTRCDRGHPWRPETTTHVTRTRPDGRVYRMRVCTICRSDRDAKRAAKIEKLKADRSLPGYSMRAARIEARKRVDDIDDHILRMVDNLELMSRLEIAQWNEVRVRMLREKDDLVRRFHFA